MKPDPVSDSDLLRLLDEEIATGVSFENDDAFGDMKSDDDRCGDREAALEYYEGRMIDLPAPKGRSRIVSHDVADTIDQLLPGLMRVFAGADKVVVYAPTRQGDEQFAAQATDYVNYVWQSEANGYLVLHTAILDALQVRNGIVKAYWDDTPEYETEDLTGLSDMQLTQIAEDPEVEFAGHNERLEMVPDQMSGAMMPMMLHDIRVRRVIQNGRLKVENVPPEDFGISKGAKSIATARCVWHRTRMTRSDLVKQGYDQDLVDALPSYSGRADTNADLRDGDDWAATGDKGNGANAEIEVTEAYLFADCDGDGIAESRKIVTAGGSGGRRMLSNEAWSDDRPFQDIPCLPVPHRWMARSIADLTMPIQRVKTALWRAVLDNTYLQNNPSEEVLQDAIIDPDELTDRSFGRIVRVKAPNAIRPLPVPYVAGNTLQAIQALDSVAKRRTGVDQGTMALDATALDPQTATAEQIEHDASYARVELIARGMAELGLKPLFAKILKIITRNQDRPRTIRLRDQWMEFDPRAWNATMDATIQIGLGTGSRERDLKMLTIIEAAQMKVIETLGTDNPVVTPSMFVATQHKKVEAAGLKDPESYFKSVSDQDFAKWQASKPPPPPDPKMQAVQAKIQGDQQRLQADVAMDQQRQQADMRNNDMKLNAQLQAQREKLQAEFDIKRQELEKDFELRVREMQLEAELKGQEMAMGLHASGLTNISRQ